jgi:prepilin-type N-terminal cleavage/methylation domain-containing protein
MIHSGEDRRLAGTRRVLGFTVIEVLTVLLILSVVARIGLPRYQNANLKAQAAQAVADLDVIRAAAIEYQSDHDGWPADVGPGQSPPELRPYLAGLSFKRGDYQLDWQNWRLPEGLPGDPEVRGILAVSIVTEHPALAAAVGELLGSMGPHFSVGNSYTVVLDTD